MPDQAPNPSRGGGNRVLEIPEDRFEDPREQQEWFLRLPDHAKEEMRRRWRMAEGRTAGQKRRRKATHLRYVLEGALLLALTEILWVRSLGVLVALLFGAAAGGVQAWLRAGTYLGGMIGFVTYTAFYVTTPWGNVFSYIFYVAASTCLGAIHNLRKSDGSEI